MKGFWQKHKKKVLSYGHLIVAIAHLIMEILFDNFSNLFSFEVGLTVVLTVTAIIISIYVILDEKKQTREKNKSM